MVTRLPPLLLRSIVTDVSVAWASALLMAENEGWRSAGEGEEIELLGLFDLAGDPDEVPAAVAAVLVDPTGTVELARWALHPAAPHPALVGRLIRALADRSRARGARRLIAPARDGNVEQLMAAGFQPDARVGARPGTWLELPL
jgi:hypothetical protein